MKPVRQKPNAREKKLLRENEELSLQLSEAQETLRAIREGEVDAVVVSGPKGEQIYSLVGAESIYRLIVETMKEAAFTVSLDGLILFCNAQFAEMVQRPEAQILGHPMSEFVAESDRAAVESLLLLSQKQPLRRRMVFAGGTGIKVPAHIAANVLAQADGVSICVVATDLTALENSTELINQLRQQQAALRASEERLARLNGELEQKVQERTAQLQTSFAELEHFSYSITHDMRAPLRAMRSFAAVLLEECATCLNPLRRNYLERIAAAADRMDHLIVDALDYSKAMRADLSLEPVDAESLLHGILESYPEYQEPHAKVCLQPPIPRVWANQAGLTQCFSNLLTNAVKFVAQGQVPEVRIRAETKGDFVRLWFEDNGIGIPLESQDRIFDMFQRLSKAYEGTGIGLAMVRKVAERMGGRVGVQSEPERGSRFWLELRAVNQ